MKIYTKTGDRGETGLYRGGRVGKDSMRIASVGAVDELNAHIGRLRSLGLPADSDALLQRIQNDLFVIGADLATPESAVKPGDKITRLAAGSETFMEAAIDEMEAGLEPLTRFILPGGSEPASQAHICRTVCRRAERGVVALQRVEPVADVIIIYLNRLSDFLFVLARHLNKVAGVSDVNWE